MKLKHAIVGCGHIAPSHVDACTHNGVEIITCFDIDIAKAKKFARTHKIRSVANSLEELLNNKTIDTVSVCTDHKSHAELATKILESEKNVVVEKPIALSLKGAKKMILTAKKQKKVLTIIS